MYGFDISHVRNELQSMIKKGPKMRRKWSHNPEKSPPDENLKQSLHFFLKNDPKLLPRGVRMENPGPGNFGNGGLGAPYPVGPVPITGLMC